MVTQPWLLTRNGNRSGSREILIPKSRQNMQKLSDKQAIALAEMGLRLENHYGRPQDVEWAVVGDRLNILQSRPITTTQAPYASPNEGLETLNALVSGASASPGIGPEQFG